MLLADAFIQSDLQCIQAIHFLSVCVFPGNQTHNLCAANTMLYHWATGTQIKDQRFWSLRSKIYFSPGCWINRNLKRTEYIKNVIILSSNIFTVTSDQFNASLLNKSIIFFAKILLTPDFGTYTLTFQSTVFVFVSKLARS